MEVRAKVMVDFDWLANIPVVVEKRRILEKVQESQILPSRKMRTSSTDKRWVRTESSNILRAQRSPSFLADAIKRLSPSMTIKKIRVEVGIIAQAPFLNGRNEKQSH